MDKQQALQGMENGDFGKLTNDWRNIDSIILYGAGIVATICKNLFQIIDINIPFIIDQDLEKQGSRWQGIPIISFEQAKEKMNGEKIVVMTAHTAYNNISAFLNSEGLIEFRDYCRIGQFICEWFWNTKGLNCIYHIDTAITTRCTLNCKNCNMFIPYYKEHRDYTFEELKANYDLLFERIDYVAYIGFVGGEPFLNPAVKDVIEYLEERYGTRIGHISIPSNGSVIPSDETLGVMAKYNIHTYISDYSTAIPYQKQLDKLQKKYQEYGINYDVNQSLEWCDFGFPEKPYCYNEEQLEKHLACCRPDWNGLNDRKFYYCNVSWSAEKCGRFKLNPADYIVLDEINPKDKEACHRIVELSRSTSSFCRICGGCGSDNHNFVPIGVQMGKNNAERDKTPN